MKLSPRDRRALLLLGAAVAVVFLVRWATADKAPPVVKPGVESETIPAAELHLERVRRSMARVPGKEEVLKQVAGELAVREKGLIEAETVNQAQAQVIDLVKKLARQEGMDVRQNEFFPPRAFGDAYGEVSVAINAECRIEQLVNFLADLANQPQLVATSDLRVSAADQKKKTMNVRVTVSGIVPRRLVPEKKR